MGKALRAGCRTGFVADYSLGDVRPANAGLPRAKCLGSWFGLGTVSPDSGFVRTCNAAMLALIETLEGVYESQRRSS
jgi:hypothetical protein